MREGDELTERGDADDRAVDLDELGLEALGRVRHLHNDASGDGQVPIEPGPLQPSPIELALDLSRRQELGQ